MLLSGLVVPPLIADALTNSRAFFAFSSRSASADSDVRVGLVIRMAVLAVRFASVFVRPVIDAIKLIGAVVADFEIRHAVVRRVAVRPMIDLQSVARPNEGCVDQAVNQVPPQYAILLQPNPTMTSVTRFLAKQSPLKGLNRTCRASRGVRRGPDASKVGDLIEPVALNWLPHLFRHIDILLGVRRGYR
jgi:hypothetical protein